MKRFLAVLVCIAMLLPLLPVIGTAAVVTGEIYYDFNDYDGTKTTYNACSFGTVCPIGTIDEAHGISIKRTSKPVVTSSGTSGQYINFNTEFNGSGVVGFSYYPVDGKSRFGIGAKGSSGSWDSTALNGMLDITGATIKAGSKVIYTGEIGEWIDVVIGVDVVNHKRAVFVNQKLVDYAAISEDVTMLKYYNFNIYHSIMSDSYVEGSEITDDSYASVWFDDFFAYVPETKLTSSVAKFNADPVKSSEITFDFGNKVIINEEPGVTFNGEAVSYEQIKSHGYVTGIKLSGLSLEEKSEYKVAFPGIVDALNCQIADYSFTTGIANVEFSLIADVDEDIAEDSKLPVSINASNIEGDIEIYLNDALYQTVPADTGVVYVKLLGGKNEIYAKAPSMGITTNVIEVQAIDYEVIKTYSYNNFDNGKVTGMNIGAKVYVLDENGDYTYTTDSNGNPTTTKATRSLNHSEFVSYVDHENAEDGKFMRITASAANNFSDVPYFSHPSGAGTYGTYVLEYDVRYTHNTAGTFFSLKTKDANGKDQWKNQLYEIKAGKITAKNATVFETVEPNKWYNFKATFDMTSQTSDFYVDGVKVANDIPCTPYSQVLYGNNTLKAISGTDTWVDVDNYKAYFIGKKFNVDVDFNGEASSSVSTDGGIINLTFDQPVNGEALVDVVLYGSDGSQFMTGFTTEDNIHFTAPLSGLKKSTAYTFDLGGVTTYSGLAGNVSEITFSTVKNPLIAEAEDYLSANGGGVVGRTLFMDNDDPSKFADVTGVRLDSNYMNDSTFTDENKQAIYDKQEGIVLDVDKLVADGKLDAGVKYNVFAKASSLTSEGSDSFYAYKVNRNGDGAFITAVGGIVSSSNGYPAYYGIPGAATSTFREGRGFTAANAFVKWVKVGDATLNNGDKLWVIGREDAFIDKVLLVPENMKYNVDAADAYEKENVVTYTATFKANDKVYYTVEFEPGTTKLSNTIYFSTKFDSYDAVAPNDEWAQMHPDYANYFKYDPSTETKAYKWANYTLADADIEIGAVESNGAVPVLDSVFNNGMVLQRNKNVNIYGECPVDGVTIEVSILGQTKTATVKDGKWNVVLDPMQATDSTSMRISAIGGDSIELTDVAVGEIWLCMGQSNMNQRLSTMEDFEDYKADMANNNIRVFAMSEIGAYSEQGDVTNGKWLKATPSTASNFSAIGYVMAEKLHKTLGVPVGLLFPARGGTNINVWISEEILRSRPEYDSFEAKYDAYDPNGTYTNDDYHEMPTSFYNNMVYPLMPYTVSGALWYQGCNNKNDDQNVYKLMFRDMVANWREGFENPDMPVITFQLAPYNDNFMAMRQTQFELAKEDDNVYLVSTAYEGYTRTAKDEESGAIHPYRKSPVAKRAAHIALNNVYGNTTMGEEYYPPYAKSAYTLNGEMYVEFDHVGSGLAVDTTTFDNLEGFEVSEDGNSWADARAEILSDGKTVKLASATVSVPKFARYGYVKEVIEYTDRTTSTKYDETKTLLRSTLGGNLTNNTGYPSFAFYVDSSSVQDNRADSGALGGNVIFSADGSEFINEDGSFNALNHNLGYLNVKNPGKADLSVAAAPSDENGFYGEALKMNVKTNIGNGNELRFCMPDGGITESFTLSFDYYAGNNFKINLRPYYYKTGATTVSNALIFKQKWNTLVSADEKTKYKDPTTNKWTKLDIAFDLEESVARLYVDKQYKATIAIDDMNKVSYVMFGLEAASYTENVVDEATGETVKVTKYHDTVGYLDNVEIVKSLPGKNDAMTAKVVDTLLARADNDISNVRYTYTNNGGGTVETVYEDKYRGNVIKYTLPGGVTNSNTYGTIGVGAPGADVTLTVAGVKRDKLLPSDGKEFVVEMDLKFGDFNYSKAYGALNHYAKTSPEATDADYIRASTVNPFHITTTGKLKFGLKTVVAQLETDTWYSFKAVYDLGTEDTDLPVVKGYLNGKYLGEISAYNGDTVPAYYNVDYVGYVTYNHGLVEENGSVVYADNIRFYTTKEETVVPSIVENFAAYQNGEALGTRFSEGAITFEALYKAESVDFSTVTMVAARYNGSELIGIASETYQVGTDAIRPISVTLPDDMMQDVDSDDYIKVMFINGTTIRPLAKAIGSAN